MWKIYQFPLSAQLKYVINTKKYFSQIISDK